MSDGSKKGIARVLQWIPVLALVVTATSLLLTVAARKKELTCTLTGTTKLVSVDVGGIHPDLKMEFHGNHVQSLTRMSYVMKNSGAAAIKAEDVRVPLHLKYPSDVKVLSASVDKTNPSELSFIVKVIPESSEVQCDIPLLNSGDEAAFSVYLINSPPAVPTFSGRIVDVPRLIFEDSSAPLSEPKAPFIRSHAVRTVLYGILSITDGFVATTFFVVALVLLGDNLKFRAWKRKWQAKYRQTVSEGIEEYEKSPPEKIDLAPDDFEVRHAQLPESVRKKVIAQGIPMPDPSIITSNGALVVVCVTCLCLMGAFIFVSYLMDFVFKG